MGIIANVKDKASSAIKKVEAGANNKVSSLAALSPNDVESLDKKRADYLSSVEGKLEEEKSEIIAKNMASVGIEVYQAYLSQLKETYSPIDLMPDSFQEDNQIRYLGIDRWVIDSEEKNLDKLVNVYEVLAEEKCNIALIIHRGINKCIIDIGVVNTDEVQVDPAIVDSFYSRINSAIKGNFPGTRIHDRNSSDTEYGIGIPNELKNLTSQSVAVVSNLASDKSEDFLCQGMEKLLDGFVPQNEKEIYTIVLLASSLQNQKERKNRLSELFSELSPYATWSTNFGFSESDTKGSTFTLGANIGLGFSQSDSVSSSFSASYEGVGASSSVSHTNTVSENFGLNFARSSNVNVTLGKNQSLTQTFTNYSIKHTLDEIEKQIERIEESSSTGCWEFAAYVLSPSTVIANNVAHMYLALTQGDESHLNNFAIALWDGNRERKEAEILQKYIQKMQHPCFCRRKGLDDEWLVYPTLITPSTIVSGKELAKALNFPQKSVSGIPVLESVSFGREPHSVSELSLDLRLGSGYHMRETVSNQEILISKEELTKHTFITGSTGSGKSTTIYRLLESLNDLNVNFLVVEPAKGEYKNVLGKRNGVNVFGTNPNASDSRMLHINPFSFPISGENGGVHILEHLDRLVEIFNVCWPMYAAMPAVLKNAIEEAYIAAGWDLETSTNKYSTELFPTFDDVTMKIKEVLARSEYSADNKGDYTGALVTRLKSLTNGINGLIFTSDAISDEELFDQNTIVDLSRVGSSETKSLIMGLLVIKMQEYRMQKNSPNQPLNHVTVLEEAHNLLRNSLIGQSGEGSHMQAKAVEMLSNAIAEMRTYGEGFVIADQSPGLLDMSVIRNTNTKIIMRLPDKSDRDLVGKASGLSDEQIEEVSRLDVGVAAISQSGWLEPVLCKVDLPLVSKTCNSNVIKEKSKASRKETEKSILDFLMNKEIYRKGERIDLIRFRQEVIKSSIDTRVKCDLLEYLDSQGSMDVLRKLLYDILDGESIIRKCDKGESFEEWKESIEKSLSPYIGDYSEQQQRLVFELLMYYQVQIHSRDMEYRNLLNRLYEIEIKAGDIK